MKILPKKQPKFLIELEQREASKNISLQLDRQRHQQIKKNMSKFLDSIK